MKLKNKPIKAHVNINEKHFDILILREDNEYVIKVWADKRKLLTDPLMYFRTQESPYKAAISGIKQYLARKRKLEQTIEEPCLEI